ncbi:mitotic spindle assembly checkpoint protein MAD1 [Cherax quadricarinatus]
MDLSPEPTMVVKALKDLNQFLTGGNKSGDSCLSGSRRLNFSGVLSENSSSSFVDEDFVSGFQTKKRHLDSLAGFGKSSCLEKLESLRLKQLRDKELIDDLQHKVKQVQNRERETQECANKVKKECNTISFEIEAKMIKMQQEHMEQYNTFCEKISDLRKKVLGLEKDVDEKSSELELTKCHTAELEENLAGAQERLKESGSNQLQLETLQLQHNREKAKVQELKLQLEKLEVLRNKADVFDSTVGKFSLLQKELSKLKEDNKFLRETARNTELLEEKLDGAQQLVKLLEKRCEDNAYLQAENDLLKETVQQYESVVKKEFGFEHKATPQELQHHITKLKQGDETLTEGIAQLRASQKSLEESRVSEEEEIKALKARLGKQMHNNQQNAHLIKRLQRKLILATKERDGLKSILDSYDSEVTINHSVVSQEKITKLEGLLELYKQELQHHESELDILDKNKTEETAATQPRKEDAEKISSLEKKVLELESEIVKLKHAREVLELRLEHRALKGDYDPTKIKILHFEKNPLAKAIENRGTEIQCLQTENEALRERVKLLEQGQVQNLTERVGMKMSKGIHSSKEVAELKVKIKSTEMQNKRLLEVFKRKSKEMREVVYQLTGYRVDVFGDKHYKLINMYADSCEDYFLFEETPKKELQLLETDFSSTLEDLIDAYLHHQNSYPAFLSAVTLDLFNKQTVEQSPSNEMEEENEAAADGEAESGEPRPSQNEYDDDEANELIVVE